MQKPLLPPPPPPPPPQQQQQPRRHLPLHLVPSRRRVRNYPHGHSGDQIQTYNLLSAVPRPRRLSYRRLLVRDSLGP